MDEKAEDVVPTLKPSRIATASKVISISYPCVIPSLAITFVGIAGGPIGEQVRDLFRILIERGTTTQVTGSIIDIFLLAFTLWFFTDWLIRDNPRRFLQNDDRASVVFAQRWPLVVALCPVVSLTWASQMLGDEYIATQLVGLIVGVAALAMIIVLSVVKWDSEFRTRLIRGAPWLLGCGSGVGTLLFAVTPVWWGQLWGPLANVLAGTSAWVTLLALIKGQEERRRIPLTFLLILLCCVNSYFNGSAFRRVESRIVTEPNEVGKEFTDWVERRSQEINARTQKQESWPVFVVSAEGGGIRAASHTLLTLCMLQDANPDFSKHLFAISGVSGGSVGGALFAALIDEYGSERHEPGFYEAKARQLLLNDYLSGSIGRLYFTDMPASLMPFQLSWTNLDRSNALAESFRVTWRKVTGSDALDDFLIMPERSKRGQALRIHLFLNATSLKLGQHRVLSNLSINPLELPGRIGDLSARNHKYSDVRVCDAMSLSARFPVVTGAGLLDLGGPSRRDWLLDGGYIENTGIATIYAIVQRCIKKSKFGMPSVGQSKKLKYVLIRIGAPGRQERKKNPNEHEPLESSPAFASGLAPFYAAAAAFTTNAQLSLQQRNRVISALKWDYFDSKAFSLDIDTLDFSLPDEPLLLGWTISNSSLEKIRKNIRSPALKPGMDSSFMAIVRLLENQ